ncbi:ATPase [Candidatus Pacearchaeota archaeon CG10_big_fil_rev_8_21_14_0_10_35_13]|nr:MAG: ATPase [Candidatus Pacearchaeota archaeon CG10_big_fil_rev_8_21_14_0_10_35_13]
MKMGVKLWVIKASGQREPFDDQKLVKTLMRAGASKPFALTIVSKVKGRVYDGVRTKEILKMALSILRNDREVKNPAVAMKYSLKTAIMSLGPSGFPFEKFFAEVLNNYGYKTLVGKSYPGTEVMQEVDVSANDSSNKRFMVECKYHNQHGIYTDLKVAMYTHARFLDLKKFFDVSWLATNTKLTNDAIDYARGVGMRVTTWGFPKGESLQELIEKKGLYPITVISRVRGRIKDSLIDSGVVTIKQLVSFDLSRLSKDSGIPLRILDRLRKEASVLVKEGLS